MTGSPISPRLRGESRDKVAAQLAKQYEGGASLRALVNEHGRSYGFIRTLVLAGGATLRGRGGDRKRRS